MRGDHALANEISMICKALADLEPLIAKANTEQRKKLKEIRLTLELALEAAPSSCTCGKQPARTCSLTGIRVEPI